MEKEAAVQRLMKTAGMALAFILLTMAMTFHPILALAGQETEPNDKLGQANATVSGDPMSGAFGYAGDQDWYKITVATRGRLRCSVINPPANIRANITLYSRHADYLYVTKSAVNDGDNVYLSYDVMEPGTYFIRLHDRDNDASPDPYTFTAVFTPVVDAHEPNNRLGQATLVTATAMTGTIFDRSDEDWYKIYATTGATLRIQVTPPAEMRPSVVFYNPDLGYMYAAGQAVNPGDPVTVEHTVTATGLYYIQIRDALGLAHLTSYGMSVTGGTPGYLPTLTPVTAEAEDNGSIGKANAAAVGSSVSGTITPAADRDWFRFDVARVGQLTIALDAVPADLQLRFALYDSSGGHLLSGQPTKIGEKFSITYDVTTPGPFYLRVEDVDGARASSGSYAFSTSFVEVTDPFELNDNYGDAVTLGELNRINAYIFSRGDQDWYRVTTTGVDPLRIILSDLPSNIAPDMAIYNASKERLAGKTGAAGMDMELTYTVPAPGSYFIRVGDGGNNDASTQPYTLTVHGATFGAYAPTARIDRIDPGSIVAGDAIEFTGSGFDSDGTITGYAWRSNIDGNLSTAAAFSTSALSIGTHTIYLKVQDNSGIWSTEVTQVVYVGSSVADEVESNDLIGQANEIAFGANRPVRAKIDLLGDVDFFKVYIGSPGRLTCSVTNVPENLRLSLTYYGRNLDYRYITGNANQDGDSVTLAMNITEPGFYYLRIHDRDNHSNAEFTYTLTAIFAEAADPQGANNSMLDAFTLTADTVQGYLFPAGDQDWFRVWVDKGQTLGVAVTDTPANLRPYVTLYGRNREYLYAASSAENEGDNPPLLTRAFDEAGYVYIRVHDRDNDYNETQMYRLTVTGANPGYKPPDIPAAAETENNDVIADANFIVPESAVQGTMGKAGDFDWFRFRMPTAGIIHARLSPVPGSMRGRMQLFRDDASYLNGRDATNPGDNMALDTRVTRPGYYFIRIDDINRTTTDDSYRLLVSVTPVVDVHEPNNVIGDATVLSDRNRTQAMIFNQGDEDWYRVAVEAGIDLQVTVADTPAEIRPQIEIFNKNGSWLAGKTATNAGQELTLTRTMEATEDCYFRIRHAGTASFSTTPYTLIVNGARFNAYTPLAQIDAVSPNPAAAGEAVTLEGHGTDADGEIIGYAWRSSLDGPLSSSRVAMLDQLSAGTHTLYFKVMDNDNNWSPETSATLYYGVPAPQEEEPNDAIGQANPMDMGKGYTGAMNKVGDYDFFRIHIPQAGRLAISVTNPTGSAMRTYLTMYTLDADNAYLTASANADGDQVTLSWDLAEAGDYYLRVHDSGNRANGQYTATATFQAAPDPYEPNPNPAHATALNIGDIIQGYIFPAGDEDWYQVQLGHPGTLTVSLTNMPSNLRGYVTIYNSNAGYTYVASSAVNEGDNPPVLSYHAATPGPYYIRIHDRDNDKNPAATYTLTTGFTASMDLHEPNNAFGQATPVTASPLQGEIFPQLDNDWYRIRAQAGASLVMTVDNVPANLRPNLTLYGANNNYLVYGTTDTDGGSVALTYTVPQNGAGYYYLRVHDRDSDFIAGSPYRLTITGADFTPVPPGQPVQVESGLNTQFRFADLIDTRGVSGTFGGGEDWYRFETAGPSLLTLSLNVPATIRSVIALYDANGAQKAIRTAQNPGDLSMFTFAVDGPGVWYVRIYAADTGAISTEPYQLEVSLAPAVDPYEPNNDFANARPLIFGEPVQATIFPQGDVDWFRFEAKAPGMLHLAIENVPPGIEMTLQVYDRNNAYKQQIEALNPGEPITMDYFAPEAGSYYVRIFDRGGNAASVAPYTFTASLAPVEDPFEPNNRFSQATELNEKNQVAGLIYPAGDLDWYAFTVAQPGTLTIQIAEADGIQPRIELYSSSKGYLANMAAKNVGDDLRMTYEITTPDRYYAVIRDSGDNDYSRRPYLLTISGGVFDLHYPVAAIDSLDPNPAIQGQPVTLSGSGTAEGGVLSGYEWVSDRDGPLGQTATLTTSTLSPGMHRIAFRVRDNQERWSGWVRKRLHVTDRILTEAEYNNAVGQANPVPLQTWITGRIYPRYDEDFYKIYVDARGYLSALVDAVPPAMRAYITFYDAAGTYLYRTDAAQNDGEWLAYEFFVEPGWYYVRIHDRDGRTHEGSYGLFFGFAPTLDIYEPNDVLSGATPMERNAAVADAFISRPGDVDWYRVEIPSPGRLSLSLTDMPPAMRGSITLYDTNGDYLYVAENAYNDGEDVFRDYDALIPGSYYIRVHDRDNRAHTQPYTFTTRFVPVVDAHEPNNAIGVATLMTESPVSAFIFRAGDEDWYRVFAPEGATLSLSVTGTPAAMRPSITVYDTNMNYAYSAQTANNSGDNLYHTYAAPAAGVYYIRVADSNNASHTTPYQFAVEGGTLNHLPPFAPVTQEEAEPNKDSGLANDVSLSTNVAGAIDPNTDYDWFRFYVNAPGEVTVTHTVPATIRSEMWVYNADKGQVGYRTTTNNGEENVLVMTVARAGYYFVRLRDATNTGSTSPYTLRIDHAPVVDGNEPNNAYGTATPLGQSTVQGYLFPNGDQDWYRVYVRSAGTLSLSLDVVPDDLRPRLYLYDADKNQRGTWVNTNPGVGGEDLITYSVPGPGFYFVRVNNEDAGYSGSPYTLRVTGADFSLAPILKPVGNREIDATIAYTVTIGATDPDNEADLVYSASNLPPGAVFDPATRTFRWTPAKGQTGTFAGIVFTVSDGTYSASETITLTVNPSTPSPLLSPIGNKSALAEKKLEFTISATDPDGGTLAYNATGLPTGATFDPATRTFSWTPTIYQIRLHENIRFEATNGVWTAFEIIAIDVKADRPRVSTGAVTEITRTGALAAGETLSTGGATITERGVVYSRTSGFLEPEGTVAFGSGGLGKYTVTLENLIPNTTYYVRAYGVNSAGTGYGDEVAFVTAKGLGGDINGDGAVDLTDAVLCLQIITGVVPGAEVRADADVNGDGKIGPAELLYILQSVAALRN